MKKAFAIILFTALILPVFGCTNDDSKTTSSEVTSMQEISQEVTKEVILRFAAMSDIHMDGSSTQTQYKRLEQALDFMYSYAAEQDYKNMDALIVGGDMTDNGYENQLKAFANVITNKLQEGTQKVFVMGNHEYYNNIAPEASQQLWESTVNTTRNTHITINGYHFIGVSPANESDFSYIASWLDEQLASAAAEDPNKPIFVVQHYHITDTVYGSDLWGTTQLTTVLNKYPQVVDFSGHSHYPVNDPRSIDQDKFTALGCGTLSYFELEGGMVYGTIPPNASKAAQFYIVEVYSDSSIAFKPYDLITSQFFPAEYIIENPSDINNFIYTDARYEAADNPVFAEGTTLDISNITDNGCKLSFQQATDGENLHSYRFDFYLKSDNTKKLTFKIWSEFYFLEMPESMSYSAIGLDSGTEYKVTVTAIDSYGKESVKPIEATFTTTGDAPAPFDPNAPVPEADILDIIFDSTGAKDVGPLSKTVENINAKIEADTGLDGDYVAKFTGNGDYLRIKFTGADYEKYTTTISIAAKLKINEFPETYSDAFANMQSGGYGFEVNGATEQIEFWICLNGEYKTICTDISTGEFYSLAGTYDGSTVNLYINGELAASAAASGAVTYPAETAAYAFCIGSDVSYDGSGESFFNGSVAYAKAYSVSLTDEQVYNLSNQ